jgi:hypothetical protein
MKLVLIEWVDSHGPVEGWRLLDDDKPELMICESVGWLVHDGKDCKTIVPHLAGHKNKHIALQGRGDMTIPSRAIVKMTRLA